VTTDRERAIAASEAAATVDADGVAEEADGMADEAPVPAFPKIRKRRQGPYANHDCGGAPPAELLKGIHEFNEGEFFEQHETLELLWRATESDVRYLYQGVLLIGVGFHHQQQDNFHGTRAKLAAGIEMLEWFAPACQSVDVADLIARTRLCLEQVQTLGRERLQEFDRSLIPQVKLLG
jgi:predicted metal-dependent hydrolase